MEGVDTLWQAALFNVAVVERKVGNWQNRERDVGGGECNRGPRNRPVYRPLTEASDDGDQVRFGHVDIQPRIGVFRSPLR